MLVLSRKQNESIVINDNITLVVVEIRGDKVRLGISVYIAYRHAEFSILSKKRQKVLTIG